MVIVDGCSLLFRAYYAVPEMLSQDNLPIGALYGFIQSLKSTLWKVLPRKSDAMLAVALDVGGGTNFRYAMCDEYKKNRPALPEGLIYQLQLIRSLLEAFGIKYVSDASCEADDVIAAYASHAASNDCEVVIVSSDKDLMQLISDKIMFFDVHKKRFCSREDVYARFSVKPQQICDYLAIVGDRSDNVRGIKGIGKKTAVKLLERFETLENIYANIHEITEGKVRNLLENGYESAMLSKQLVMLKDKIQLQYSLEDMKWHGFSANSQRIAEFLLKHSLDSLMRIL